MTRRGRPGRRRSGGPIGVLALLCACAPVEREAAPTEGGDARSVTVERGPVAVTLSLEPKEPRLSDEPRLTIDVAAEDGVEVEMPPFRDAVGGFDVSSFEEPPPRVEGGRAVVRQRYRLEPRQAGPHVVRPFTVTFVDRRPEGDGEEHELATEPFEVEVRSLITAEAPTLDDLAPPRGVERLSPPNAFPLRTTAFLLGGAAAAAALLLLLRRRRGPEVAERALTPTELAERELRALLEDDPLARDELPTFYVELTGVVRRYIERETGVRAPEQTTAEFLREMRTHEAFDSEARRRLREFLESADLVKFAAVRPPREDVEESFRRAQEFVGLPGTLALRPAGGGA